jgi:hypothetical protein
LFVGAAALMTLVDAIATEDAHGYFQHCDYPAR